MKKLRLFFFLVLSQCFLAQAQTIQDLEKSYIFVQAVRYEKDSMILHASLIVSTFLEDSMAYSGMHHSIWVLADSLAGNRLLGASFTSESTFPISVYNIKVSPDSRYIAVFQVAEGHPYIEIIDAQKLILQKKYELIHFLNPYPGNIDIVGWENELLIVESDMPLTDLNTTENLDYEKLTENFKKYIFDLKTKKYKAY
jgi:hypothetical protein